MSVVFLISLACFSHGALADEDATPTPTPAYLNRLARPGSLRRQEQIERRSALKAQAESRAQTKAQTKADRRTTAAAQSQARAAGRAREQAQRQVAAEARRESANATPHATSDLMSRMGFSEKEIAAQKAREQPAKPGAKETAAASSQAGRQQEQSTPTEDTADQPALSSARDAATPKPASASPTADPDSH